MSWNKLPQIPEAVGESQESGERSNAAEGQKAKYKYPSKFVEQVEEEEIPQSLPDFYPDYISGSILQQTDFLTSLSNTSPTKMDDQKNNYNYRKKPSGELYKEMKCYGCGKGQDDYWKPLPFFCKPCPRGDDNFCSEACFEEVHQLVNRKHYMERRKPKAQRDKEYLERVERRNAQKEGFKKWDQEQSEVGVKQIGSIPVKSKISPEEFPIKSSKFIQLPIVPEKPNELTPVESKTPPEEFQIKSSVSVSVTPAKDKLQPETDKAPVIKPSEPSPQKPRADLVEILKTSLKAKKFLPMKLFNFMQTEHFIDQVEYHYRLDFMRNDKNFHFTFRPIYIEYMRQWNERAEKILDDGFKISSFFSSDSSSENENDDEKCLTREVPQGKEIAIAGQLIKGILKPAKYKAQATQSDKDKDKGKASSRDKKEKKRNRMSKNLRIQFTEMNQIKEFQRDQWEHESVNILQFIPTEDDLYSSSSDEDTEMERQVFAFIRGTRSTPPTSPKKPHKSKKSEKAKRLESWVSDSKEICVEKLKEVSGEKQGVPNPEDNYTKPSKSVKNKHIEEMPPKQENNTEPIPKEKTRKEILEEKVKVPKHPEITSATLVYQPEGNPIEIPSKWFSQAPDEYKYIQPLRSYIFRVTEAVSPSKFFLQYIVDRSEFSDVWGKTASVSSTFEPDTESEDFLYDSMQKAYNDKGVQEMMKLRTEAYINRLYVTFHTESGKWERVRVLNVDFPNRSAQVFFRDIGITQWINWNSLLELYTQFYGPSKKGIKGKITEIRPIGNTKDWSQEACKKFKDLTLGKTFHCVIQNRVVRPRLPEVPGCLENYLRLYLTMIRTGEGDPFRRNVQNELIRLKVAEPIPTLY